jgi:hypothetical protein
MANQFNLLRYKEVLELEKNNKITFLDLKLLSFKIIVAQQICYTRKKKLFYRN